MSAAMTQPQPKPQQSVPCSACYGTGRNKRGGPCPHCKATGQVSGAARVGTAFSELGKAMLGLLFFGTIAVILIAFGVAIILSIF